MTDTTEHNGSTTDLEHCKRVFSLNGYFMLITLLALIVTAFLIGYGIIGGYEVRDRLGEIHTIAPYWWFGIPLGLGAGFCLLGFNVIGPNEVRVAQFFGTPLGVYDKQGFSWCNPLISMTKYSYKIRNFETDQLKINDKEGSPINVAAVIRWHVFNPEKAEYELEDYLEFLRMQVEGNLRNVIRTYPYDSGTCKKGNQTEITLSHSTKEVTSVILSSINEDITPFGLKAVDVSFNTLAYAPEIAAVMTQRQQAKAIVEAKRELSEGVVDVVESTIEKLKDSEKLEITKTDESRLATNLTLLLCSHKEADPVINIDK